AQHAAVRCNMRGFARLCCRALLESQPLLRRLRENRLNEQNAVPLIVLSLARDPVETINSILRRAGHPVHCTWIPSLRDLGDALTQLNPEVLLYVDCGHESLVATVKVRDHIAPTVPLVVIADSVDEQSIAAALLAGARDVVSLANE